MLFYCFQLRHTELNRTRGTLFGAFAAIGTQVHINGGQIVDNLSRAIGTGALALFAADTAGLADLTGVCTLVTAGAAYISSRRGRNDIDQMIGALLGAQATADAKSTVNHRDAFYDRDRAIGADRNTIAIAQTAVAAASAALVKGVAGNTGFRALIIHNISRNVLIAGAFDHSDLGNNAFAGNAHDLTDLLGGGSSAGDTQIGFGTGNNSRRIGVTAGIAAGAAVGTRKLCADLGHALIRLDSEKFGRNRKNQTGDTSDQQYDQNGKND